LSLFGSSCFIFRIIIKLKLQNTILPQFQKIGRRRTLYASDKDKALHLSEIFRGGLPRLGDGCSSLFVGNGIDTVDASNVDSSGSHHSYVFDTKELITDLHYLLNVGLPPLERRLRAKTKNSLTFWLFPR
jgi:esterase/lipase superfamily enzyme